MTVLSLFLLPFFAGVTALLERGDRFCRTLLIATALANFVVILLAEPQSPHSFLGGWLLLDSISYYFLFILNTLFFCVAVYSASFLSQEKSSHKKYSKEDFIFTNEPEPFFIGFLLFFFANMNLVLLSQHMGMIWVGIETSTLMSAPLIFYHRQHYSLEAAWKYVIICSVGLGLALLGTMFLAMSVDQKTSVEIPFLFNEFIAHSESLNPNWLHAAFIFVFIGYGAKMGLAPMHTWLPDAHSQAPSPVSALLSGALLNGAFFGILRMWQIMNAGGHGAFASDILVAFGIVSMIIAAVYLLNQAEYKRMLAYSSVEHMGIMSLGIGLGGNAVYGALLHMANHSLVKVGLFLISGNILRYFGTRQTQQVSGALKIIPVSAVLWVVGFLAITGTPPFGLFISKFIILREAVDRGHFWMAALFLFLLAVIFIGMAGSVLPMVQGMPTANIKKPVRESWIIFLPSAVLLFLSLFLGVYQPPEFVRILESITQALGVT